MQVQVGTKPPQALHRVFIVHVFISPVTLHLLSRCSFIHPPIKCSITPPQAQLLKGCCARAGVPGKLGKLQSAYLPVDLAATSPAAQVCTLTAPSARFHASGHALVM
jgi:hypothetical protein